MNKNELPGTRQPLRQVLLVFLLGMGAVLLIIAVKSDLFRFRNAGGHSEVVAEGQPTAEEAAPILPPAPDFSTSNSVSIRLGEEEAGQGLILIDSERDAVTTIESFDGVTARVVRLDGTHSERYCYFRIDPSFKQDNLRQARIDVEYLAPERGTLSVHYDALARPDGRSAAYKSVARIVSLAGTNAWQTATFLTRNDAAFSNRQNGGSDFRLVVRAPSLWVRRVTVTREPVAELTWGADYFTSNQVSVLLGQEKSGDGLRIITDVSDGITVVTNFLGVPCRYLRRTESRSPWGSFYFEISPSFKRAGLTNAQIQVEYMVTHNNGVRIQFDGIERGRAISYVVAVPTGANVVRWVTGAIYGQTPVSDAWTTATFEITNAVFQNSQNGGADFRFEVAPPEAYVRRVTVTRRNP